MAASRASRAARRFPSAGGSPLGSDDAVARGSPSSARARSRASRASAAHDDSPGRKGEAREGALARLVAVRLAHGRARRRR